MAHVDDHGQHVGASTPQRAETLQAVRKSAALWQTTLTGILGILGLGSILGRDDVQALTSGHRTWVIVLLCIAVLSAATALFLVTKAAAGLPKGPVFKRASAKDAAFEINTSREPGDQATDAAGSLRASLGVTAISLLAALGAVSILWASQDAPPGAKVLLNVTIDGTASSYCGTVTKGDAGAVTIKPGVDNASSTTFKKSQIISIGLC